MTRIKLCGIRRTEDISVCDELMPEYIGFIFVKKSRRFIPLNEALKLRNNLDKSIVSVGVFMDNSVEEIKDAVNSGVISMVQLHGSEDGDFILRVKEACKCPVIKAFGIQSQADVERANESPADLVLLDTPGGGTGNTFNHSLLKTMRREFFLAGGLNVENVGTAIENFSPYAVDVSSNIETDGIKDPQKMRAFVEAVRERN